jgi:hypothetical protein
MAQDHNDIYSIVERLRVLEEGLDKNQKSVNQLGATFKPKTVAVLTAKQDPKNPLAGKLVGGCEESVANEDVLDKVKKSLADYLSNVADEIKQDTDLKDKKKEDSDLKKKDSTDRALVAKDLDEDHQQLEVGDRVMVTGPNHYQGEFAEVAEFSPSGKFVVVKFDNGDEASMHLSDVEFHDDQEDVEDDWYDEELEEDPTEEEPATDVAISTPSTNPTLPESAPVKTVTNECGIWEVHGDMGRGFEIRNSGRAMQSRFKSLDEAVMALEMFAARRAQQQLAGDSADYVEEK